MKICAICGLRCLDDKSGRLCDNFSHGRPGFGFDRWFVGLMLVLDEQLLGRNLESDLARWYRGPVLFITDLRPATVPDSQAGLIPERLRAVFSRRPFSTKTGRMGHVLRITQGALSYYTYRDKQVRVMSL